MQIDYRVMGQRISRLRKERGFTQEELAERMEITNSYLSNIERNRSIPSLEILIRLCTVLDVTPNDILLGVNYNSKEYLQSDLSSALEQCRPEEKRLILGFLKLLWSERDKLG